MLGLDRTAARYTWTAAAILLLLAFIYGIRGTLFLLTLAVLFAYHISPAVELLDRALPGRARTLAIVYVLFIGVVVIVVTQIGSRVVDQARILALKFPSMLGEVQKQTEKHPDAVSSLQDQLLTNIRNGITQKTNELIGALPNAGLKIVSAATNVIYVVIVPFLAFFFLKDSVLIRSHLLSLADTSPAMRSFADGLMEDIHALLARYMRALVVLSPSTFTAYSTFFTIMDVPYGVLLAVLAMMLEFIPMIGPLVAGTAIVIVAAVAGSHVLAVLIFLLAFRMFQDYVLSPHIMGQGVELHPLLVLFGVFAGAEVAGVAGSFLSVPVIALIRVMYIRFRKNRLSAQLTPDQAVLAEADV